MTLHWIRLGARATWSTRWILPVAGVLLFGTAGTAVAQFGPGTTGAVLLQLPAGPRPLALAGASAALPSDAFAVFYNPARLAGAGGSAGAAFQSLPAGIGAGALAGALRLGPGTAAVGIHYLDLGAVDVVEPDPDYGGLRGRATGQSVDGADLAAGLAFGTTIMGALQLGLAGRALRSRLADAETGGWTIDVGSALELFRGRAVLAAVGQNLGPRFGLERAVNLPRILRAGAAVTMATDAGARVTLVAEGHFRDDRAFLISGIEASLAAPGGFALDGRVGFDAGAYRRDGPGPLAIGAGLTAGRISIDYAFRAMGPIGATHQFGLTLHASTDRESP